MSVYITPGTRQGSDSISGKAPAISFLLRWWKSAVRGWQRRKMIAALAALDDRILLDIGLCRGDIDDFVDGLSSAELRMVPVTPAPVTATQDRSYADLRRAA
ncbi:MAG TPA: DUF1127 domain-containing protein [Albidovulum sp.]|jgi:uncharacterized protein YjiS (DUF1127 family)|uniref:DUF1127 domain-containing protein n=1 Tax=Albidovulum sp. TaxID=1872424 RepID=UPI002CCF4BCA|nr:DUF1127 domain-containing protein [Albidovulum sp.]